MKRDNVTIRREGGREYPALNVKVYGMKWSADDIARTFNCAADVAERAAEFAYESARSQFWDYLAPDALNFALYGDEGASHYAPTGLERPPVTVYSAGRSGGWLIVEGLPPVDDWDDEMRAKWARFEQLIRDSIADVLDREQVRDSIEANRWAEPGAEAFNFRVLPGGGSACIVDDKALAAAAPELRDMLDDVLHTCEMNLDDMEPETVATIERARALLSRLPQRAQS